MSPEGRPSLLPARICPMLAVLAPEPFDSPDFRFEVKWDGIRCLAFLEASTRLQSRHLNDLSGRYPDLADLHLNVGGQPAVLDGEIVVLADGAPDFGALLARHQLTAPARLRRAAEEHPVTYVAFDLLYWKGQSVMGYPLRRRHALLAETVREAANLVVTRPVEGQGVAYAQAVFARGLEGVMAKRLDSPYLPGKRSPAWLKLKRPRTLLAVIGGFTERTGGGVGSVVVGAFDPAGNLRLVGRAAVTLPAREAQELFTRLLALRQETCPFAEPPRVSLRDVRWVRPELVCRIQYLERSSPGHLRHAVYRELLDAEPARACDWQLTGDSEDGERG